MMMVQLFPSRPEIDALQAVSKTSPNYRVQNKKLGGENSTSTYLKQSWKHMKTQVFVCVWGGGFSPFLSINF